MRGREYDNVSEFFPPVDRNLLDKLDQRLRSRTVNPDTSQERVPPLTSPLRTAVRINIDSHIEAVGQAGEAIAAMTTRIDELEHHIDTTTRQFQSQLVAADQALRIADDRLRAETERSSRFEGVAANQTARALELERELSSVRADLARLANAITETLGFPAKEDGPAR